MPLTVRQIDTAQPKEKEYKLSDAHGLYLLVKANGSKYWRLKYRIDGKEKKLSIGVYPQISLAEARQKREEARKIISAGGDPSKEKQQQKAIRKHQAQNTFRALALEWHEYKKKSWSQGYADDLFESLYKDIFPYIGNMEMTEIKPLDMLNTLRKLEKRGVLDKLRKIRQACNQIFKYAIVTGRADMNPVADLSAALAVPKAKHFPYLVEEELPVFLTALSAYSGSLITKRATKMLMLTDVRTTELRAAKWSEFDFDKKLWEIPVERMKMKRPHWVPLSDQVIEILTELKALTGRYPYVFTGRNDLSKPISEASINKVLKMIGYHGKATGHGFRHTMSTILHEQGYNTAWIAHVDKNSIRGTYNHAQYLEGRHEILQWYADHMDELEHSIPKKCDEIK